MIANALTSSLQAEDDRAATTTTTEVQADLESVDASELIQHLSSEDSRSRLTLLYHGSTCSYLSADGEGSSGGSERSSRQLCLPVALNTAHMAFELHRTTMQAAEMKDTVKGSAERFLRALLNVDVLEECLQLRDEWLQPFPSLESLIELEPFTQTFGKVLLLYHPLTNDGFLDAFRQMWENAPHLPIIAGVMTYETESILCLRVQVGPTLYTYVLFDCHARPKAGRGPAFIIHKSREDVAGYLYSLWKAPLSPLQAEEVLDFTIQRFSVHLLLHSHPPVVHSLVDKQLTRVELDRDFTSSAPKIEESSSTGLSNHTLASSPLSSSTTFATTVATTPSAETETAKKKHKSTKSISSSINSLKTKPSGHRLQSEFGWQLGLQHQKIITPLQGNLAEAEAEATTKFVEALQARPTIIHKPEPEPVPSLPSALDSKQTPSARSRGPSVSSNGQALSVHDSKPSRDLSKKDIGWQLGLQKDIGAVKLPSKEELMQKDHEATNLLPRDNLPQSLTVGGSPSKLALETPLPQSPKSNGSSSTANLSLNSGRSGNSNPPPRSPPMGASTSSETRADKERQKPVRNDFGWQLGLAAKSMTFPMQQPQVLQNSHPSPSNLSLNVVGLNGAPSPSHLVSSEFGTLQDADAKASSTLISQEALSKDLPVVEEFQLVAEEETADCEYCFGFTALNEQVAVGPGRCNHKLCRDCVRRHILQELEKRQYPISCPVCTLISRISPTILDVDLMEQLDFSEIETDKLRALEFQTLPVNTGCPKCQTARILPRRELMNTKILECWAPGCRHQWCRACRKEIGRNQLIEDHMCKDYRDKTDKMLRKKGKYCPGCQGFVYRPKTDDNRLECSSICGLHFCFICGEAVADTTKGQDLERFTYLHYTQGRCSQFGLQKDEKCVVQ